MIKIKKKDRHKDILKKWFKIDKKLELNTIEGWNKYEFEEKSCKILYHEKSTR
jgi:hypothetical protein